MNNIYIDTTIDDGIVTAKILIESTTYKDTTEKTFIREIKCKKNKETVLTTECGPHLSLPHYLAFKFQADSGDKLNISWVDNKGRKSSKQTVIE